MKKRLGASRPPARTVGASGPEAERRAARVLRSCTPMTFRQIGERLGGIAPPGVARGVRVVENTPALRAAAEAVRRIMR